MRITSTKLLPMTKSALVAMLFASTFKADVTLNGTATYYDVGLGSCGGSNGDSELVCALGYPLYDRFKSLGPASNGGSGSPLCSKKVTVTNPESKKSVVVTVVDRCECPLDTNGIDLSPSAFKQLGDTSAGRLSVVFTIHGVGEGSGGGYGPASPSSPELPHTPSTASPTTASVGDEGKTSSPPTPSPIVPPTPPVPSNIPESSQPRPVFKPYNYKFTDSGNSAKLPIPDTPVDKGQVNDVSGNNPPSSPITSVPMPSPSPQVPPPNPVVNTNPMGGPNVPTAPQSYGSNGVSGDCTKDQGKSSVPPPSLSGDSTGASVARCEGNKVVYPQAEGSTLQPFVQECANGLTCQARGSTVTCA